jgi:hypothetical protein
LKTIPYGGDHHGAGFESGGAEQINLLHHHQGGYIVRVVFELRGFVGCGFASLSGIIFGITYLCKRKRKPFS